MERATRRGVVATAMVVGGLMAASRAARGQDTPAPEDPPARPKISGNVYVQSGTPKGERVAVPRGWLGIHYVCDIETWPKDGELFVRHNGYPLVASVEPDSPADRAGIEAGDTIVAYNNEDINGRAFSLTKLLKPGSKLNVRILRARKTRDIPVVVARRTMYAPDVGAIASNVRVEVDSITGLVSRVSVRRGGTPRAQPSFVIVDPARPTPALAPVAPLPPSPISWSSTTALAGAELVRVTPDLGESFGVERGVLVLAVGMNTPAARAGLRGGDVITRVDGADVVTPAQFQRALQRADGGVKLTIVRKKREKGIELKW